MCNGWHNCSPAGPAVTSHILQFNTLQNVLVHCSVSQTAEYSAAVMFDLITNSTAEQIKVLA